MIGKVRVLEVGPGNFGKGGISVIAWNWYSHINKDRVAVDFIATMMPEEKYIREIEANGGHFYHSVKSGNKIKKQFENFAALKKAASENHYDCIHIHASNAFTAAPAYLAVKGKCPKIIIHSHSTGIDGTSSGINASIIIKKICHKLCRLFMPSENVIFLACSDEAARWVFPAKVCDGQRYTILKNGIDAERFAFDENKRNSERARLGISDRFVIGHVGRFAYPKNHEFLINVFAEVHKKEPCAVLLLVGNGEAEESIRSLVGEKGLSESVIFYGTSSDLSAVYSAMDCFVLPSRFEGLGIVAIESQAAGLRTLCADTVPTEAAVTELAEYLSLNDPKEKWADTILSYNSGYERKNMSAEIKKVGYDIRRSAKQLEEIYLSLE